MTELGSEEAKALQLKYCSAVIDRFRLSRKRHKEGLRIALKRETAHLESLRTVGHDAIDPTGEPLSAKELKRAIKYTRQERTWLKKQLTKPALRKAHSQALKDRRYFLAAVWPDPDPGVICFVFEDRKRGHFLGRRAPLSNPLGIRLSPEEFIMNVGWFLQESGTTQDWPTADGDVIRWAALGTP